MFDDLPPDLDRLQALRTWHLVCLRRIDRKIKAVQRAAAERERAQQRRPRPPDWLVQLPVAGDHPLQLHAGDCPTIDKIRYRGIGRDEARRLLDGGLDSCIHCNPAARLGILG
ncbi:DUF6233 domain-containing protein [Streptomyces sp. NPDC047072]|uniref:DUF6233 domain-containing protein n=1 Tax=Streptomyces sp. NPDC047072 TaxID=3154809 RepID=UPI0033EA90E3